MTEDNPNGAGYADFHYYFNAELNCELCIACYFIDGVAYEYFLSWQL